MSTVNDLIKKKLEDFPHDVRELATEAIKLSESGLPEITVADQLANVVRQIIRKKGA